VLPPELEPLLLPLVLPLPPDPPPLPLLVLPELDPPASLVPASPPVKVAPPHATAASMEKKRRTVVERIAASR
jgi:hypothetical protein